MLKRCYLNIIKFLGILSCLKDNKMILDNLNLCSVYSCNKLLKFISCCIYESL